MPDALPSFSFLGLLRLAHLLSLYRKEVRELLLTQGSSRYFCIATLGLLPARFIYIIFSLSFSSSSLGTGSVLFSFFPLAALYKKVDSQKRNYK